MPFGSGKHKVHSSYVWMTSITAVFWFFFVMLVSVVPTFIEEGAASDAVFGSLLVPALILVGLILLLGAVVLLQVLAYRNLAFEFTEQEFNLYSGIITKRRVHVPYQRVQSVNHNATFLQRIIGVCSVSIETAGGANNKAIRVPYVQTAVAEQIRAELFSRKAAALPGAAPPQGTGAMWTSPPTNAAPQQYPPPTHAANLLDASVGGFATERGIFGGQAYDTGMVSYECKLTNKELLLSAISNSSSGIAIVASALVSILGFFGQWSTNYFVDSLLESSGAYEALGTFVGSQSNWTVLPLIGVAIAIVAIAWLLSVAKTMISFGGFSARRRDNRVEVERGLIQHQFSGLDIQRIQSVVIRQSFIRRCIGYCELSVARVDSADQAEDKSQQQDLAFRGLVIHPFVKLERVPELLAGLLPEYAALPTQANVLPKVSQRRALLRRCLWRSGALWIAACVAIAHYLAHAFATSATAQIQTFLPLADLVAILVYVICAALVIINIVSALLWFKSSSFAYNQQFMTIKNGGLSTESISFPRKKIQFGYTKTNPFQRGAKVASINVVTAAGISGTTTQLMDVAESDATAWLQWLAPRGNIRYHLS
jgi:putative membrane protein